MFLKIICILLALCVVGLIIYVHFLKQKMARTISAYGRLTTRLAGAIELYVVNDNVIDALGKRSVFDYIMLSVGEVSTYWKEFPPGVPTMLKSIRDWMERQVIITRRLTSTK